MKQTATDNTADAFAKRLRSLPPLPDVAQEIIQKFSCEFVDGNTVADIVSRDPAIAGRLIGVANSAYFGLAQPVADMRQAVNQVIGVDTVRSMAIALATQSLIQVDNCPAFDRSRFWHRALAVGMSAQRIALEMDDPDGKERPFAYLLGLCHNLGLMVLASLESERLQSLLSARDEETSLHDSVLAEFGLSIGELTIAIAEHWRLPDVLLGAYRDLFVDGSHQEGLALALHTAMTATRNNDIAVIDAEHADVVSQDVALQQAGQLSRRDREAIGEAVRALGG